MYNPPDTIVHQVSLHSTYGHHRYPLFRYFQYLQQLAALNRRFRMPDKYLNLALMHFLTRTISMNYHILADPGANHAAIMPFDNQIHLFEHCTVKQLNELYY